MYFACQAGRKADVQYLIQNGADPNIPTDLVKNCITVAKTQDREAAAAAIVSNLRGDNKERVTPLMKAALKGFLEIIKYLLSQQFRPVTIDNVYNACCIAIIFEQDECAQVLNEKYQLLEIQADSIKHKKKS